MQLVKESIMNGTITILQNIIDNFSTENLIQLFRSKTRTFREINEAVSPFGGEKEGANDIFSNGLLLGEIKLDNDDELVIYTFQTNKELTERSGKKAQYDLAKKILKQNQHYAAGFFIFYDDNNNFRLSLIYDIPQPNGKREWSNFKRFTYYVSKDQTNKTFIYRIDTADFSTLEKIKEAFSVEKVTKEFYTEIANWYFWALKNVKFPKDAEAEKNGRNIALIRFITRIIFIWFMKQKNLIKNNLFDKNEIKKILKTLSDKENTYYKAILQNLFFATLNTPISERKFRRDKEFQGKNKDYMNHNYYRYHNLFNNPDDMLSIFKDIPFLNGGLFECLDKRKDDPSNDKGEEIRIDGFSDKETNQTIFPNFLFFSDEKEVDLNKDYGTAQKKYKTRGLLNILHSYNFTIDENTPTDEEIALDPELLGRVFENLLASYNPETASTARKSTGSYYTPREIVNYMVDESLIAYLKNKMIEGAKSFIQLGTDQSDMFGNSVRKGQLKIEEELLPSRWIDKEAELETELRKLISYSEEDITFTEKEIDILINAINTSKILDPAVGSGAFPMGVLHKLVLILSKLDPHNTKWKQQQITAIESNVTDPNLQKILIKKIEESFSSNELDYGRKLYLIQNCLYGVDIQPIAIQIAKLRFFISLLVDEKVIVSPSPLAKGKDGLGFDNFGIEPLPNLETKLISANTLIGLPKTLTLKPIEIEKLEKELFDLRRNYFITSGETEKKALEKNDRELRKKIKILLDDNQFPSELAEKISNWDPYNTNTAADWFEREWMFGPDVKNGFDIVIANPPYIQLQKDGGSLAKQFEKLDFETFAKTGDIYTLFYEKGIKLLKQMGTLCYITSNKWMRAGYGEKLRNFFLEYNPKLLIDLGPNVFESATVDTNILILQNEEVNEYNLKAVSINNKQNNNSSLQNQLNEFGVTIKKLTKDAWTISGDIEMRIKEKIERIGTPLKEWDVKIYRGVLTGFNDAFIIDGKKRAELIAQDPKSAEIIKPILRGRDIKRYKAEFADLWIINSHNGIKEKGIPRIDVPKDYPAIYNHLKPYEEKLIKRQDKGDHWTNLRNCAYLEEFEKEKVVYPNMASNLCSFYDNNGFYTNQKCFIITSKNENLKFLNLFFNASSINYYFKKYCGATLGAQGFEMSKIFIENLPIPKISPEAQQPFIELVDKILAKKENNEDTTAEEQEIDIMVYKLYNLTYEEVKIIDPGIEKIISEKDYEKFEIK